MKAIGIDDESFLIYEGQRGWGQALWPQPTLLAAAIVDESADALLPAPNRLQEVPYIFVDEGYDPSSRVRKGRIFERPRASKEEWHVAPHPAVPSEGTRVKSDDGRLTKWLVTFWKFSWTPKLTQLGIERPLVLLGNPEQFTVWSVVAAEATYSGEAIIYLKARNSIGALPAVKYDRVPEASRVRVKEKLGCLSAEVHVAGPESVVDAAREALTAILSSYVQDRGLGPPGVDLAELARLMEGETKERKSVAVNLAKTVALLHSRRKNAEQEKRSPRPITEQDAELAVQCVGTVLCDLGWAAW